MHNYDKYKIIPNVTKWLSQPQKSEKKGKKERKT